MFFFLIVTRLDPIEFYSVVARRVEFVKAHNTLIIHGSAAEACLFTGDSWKEVWKFSNAEEVNAWMAQRKAPLNA